MLQEIDRDNSPLREHVRELPVEKKLTPVEIQERELYHRKPEELSKHLIIMYIYIIIYVTVYIYITNICKKKKVKILPTAHWELQLTQQ